MTATTPSIGFIQRMEQFGANFVGCDFPMRIFRRKCHRTSRNKTQPEAAPASVIYFCFAFNASVRENNLTCDHMEHIKRWLSSHSIRHDAMDRSVCVLNVCSRFRHIECLVCVFCSPIWQSFKSNEMWADKSCDEFQHEIRSSHQNLVFNKN